MTLLDFSALLLQPMSSADLDEVMAIELAVYTHPWSRANFVDALNQGYDAWVVRTAHGQLLGYYVHMAVVDESHLLTIAVHAQVQRQGLGRYLLTQMLQRARAMAMTSVLLEVRASNQRALALYAAFGFEQIGRRKGYYQLTPTEREDALVLRCQSVA